MTNYSFTFEMQLKFESENFFKLKKEQEILAELYQMGTNSSLTRICITDVNMMPLYYHSLTRHTIPNTIHTKCLLASVYHASIFI